MRVDEARELLSKVLDTKVVAQNRGAVHAAIDALMWAAREEDEAAAAYLERDNHALTQSLGIINADLASGELVRRSSYDAGVVLRALRESDLPG